MLRTRLGEAEVIRIADMEGYRTTTAKTMPGVTPELLAAQAKLLGPQFIDPATHQILLSFHSYLIRRAGKVVLVDACLGADKERPTRPFWHRLKGDFLEQLARIGVRPEDVDAVMCTHLHADHVGWNTRLVNGQWVPTFPNARYIMAEAEYRHWEAHYKNTGPTLNHGSFADSVLPVVDSGQAELVSMDHRVDAGIHLEAAPGHTPGSVLIHVEDQGQHGVMTGDLIHHPLQLACPDVQTTFCEDPPASARTRVALCERYADTGSRIYTAHFPAPSSGRILRDGKVFRFGFDHCETC